MKEKISECLKFLESKNYSPVTIRNVSYVLSDFVQKAESFTPEGLEKYLNEKAKSLSKNTIITQFNILRAFLERMEGFKKSDFEGIKWRKSKRLPVFLTEKEAMALLRKSKMNPVHYAMISFLLNTGVRVSELINIRIEDIDKREDGSAIVRIKGKGDKERFVPISKKMYALLEKTVIRNRQTGYLFTRQKGDKTSRISRQWVYNIVSYYGRVANIKKKVTPHVLRHTFATMLLEKNIMSIPQIQKVLGHSNIQTTMIYATVTLSSISKAIERLSDLTFDGTLVGKET